jgi:hypothetical protein
MINKPKKYKWKCAGKGCYAITTVLHEIFHGSANREISEDFNLQVPLCYVCHLEPHRSFRDTPKEHFELLKIYYCEWLGIDYNKALLAVNDRFNRDYLHQVKEQCYMTLMGACI